VQLLGLRWVELMAAQTVSKMGPTLDSNEVWTLGMSSESMMAEKLEAPRGPKSEKMLDHRTAGWMAAWKETWSGTTTAPSKASLTASEMDLKQVCVKEEQLAQLKVFQKAQRMGRTSVLHWDTMTAMRWAHWMDDMMGA